MTKPVRVRVFHGRDNAHCSQIFTGLSRLARARRIDLRQASFREFHHGSLLAAEHSVVAVEVNGTLACFDMRDACEVNPWLLNAVDVYFKRSYDRNLVAQRDNGHRIRRLGLNYEVYDDGLDWPAVRRLIHGAGDIKSLPRRLGWNTRFHPRVGILEHRPEPSGTVATVLFQTRLWDADLSRTETGSAERNHINEMRVACVRALKAELGPRFVGGVEPSPLAERVAPELIIQRSRCRKHAYLRTLHETPICVTTAGLHGSNGWKLGEYVAASRAIVCEPLRHEVPGRFRPGVNYLQFEAPDECVENCVRLMGDEELRASIMSNNERYYRQFLRPEAMVMNALLETQALTEVPHAEVAV